jgi:hypothetical protein
VGPQGRIWHVTPQTTLRPERDKDNIIDIHGVHDGWDKPLNIGSVFWDLLFPGSHAGGGDRKFLFQETDKKITKTNFVLSVFSSSGICQ